MSEKLSANEQATVIKNLEYLNSPELISGAAQTREFLHLNPGIVPSWVGEMLTLGEVRDLTKGLLEYWNSKQWHFLTVPDYFPVHRELFKMTGLCKESYLETLPLQTGMVTIMF